MGGCERENEEDFSYRKRVQMKGWRMVGTGKRWLGCFTDTLLHSAPWIIHHLDRGLNNTHRLMHVHTHALT